MVMSAYMLWLISGIIMMALEFVVPGFVIIFFGAGAVLTGLTVWIFGGIPSVWQTLLFVVLSLGALAAFRRHAVGSGNKHAAASGVDYDDECIGKIVKVVEPLEPGRPGKVELGGTNWSAECAEPVAASAMVEVVSRNGLTLCVKPVR